MGALDASGRLTVQPFSFYQQFNQSEICAFAIKQGLYSLPTRELVEQLKTWIGDKTALEIGAGNGVLAEALGIRATDNKMQLWPEIAQHYRALRQAPVVYGPSVEELDGNAAVLKYKPDVVVACWVTHLYREDRHHAGGNMFGVNEEDVLENCKAYIHIGNSQTHQGKSIRNRPHRRYQMPWLVSRSMQPELNEISIWGERLPGELAEG